MNKTETNASRNIEIIKQECPALFEMCTQDLSHDNEKCKKYPYFNIMIFVRIMFILFPKESNEILSNSFGKVFGKEEEDGGLWDKFTIFICENKHIITEDFIKLKLL